MLGEGGAAHRREALLAGAACCPVMSNPSKGVMLPKLGQVIRYVCYNLGKPSNKK